MMMMMMMMMTLAFPVPRGQLQPRGAPPISRAALCTCSGRSGRSSRSSRSSRNCRSRRSDHGRSRSHRKQNRRRPPSCCRSLRECKTLAEHEDWIAQTSAHTTTNCYLKGGS